MKLTPAPLVSDDKHTVEVTDSLGKVLGKVTKDRGGWIAMPAGPDAHWGRYHRTRAEAIASLEH